MSEETKPINILAFAGNLFKVLLHLFKVLLLHVDRREDYKARSRRLRAAWRELDQAEGTQLTFLHHLIVKGSETVANLKERVHVEGKTVHFPFYRFTFPTKNHCCIVKEYPLISSVWFSKQVCPCFVISIFAFGK